MRARGRGQSWVDAEFGPLPIPDGSERKLVRVWPDRDDGGLGEDLPDLGAESSDTEHARVYARRADEAV